MSNMKTLIFTLSMPGCASWDGKWSGVGKCYAAKRRVSATKADSLSGKYFSYNFGDGWRAGIDVRVADAKTTREIMKRSQGFCAYDWMVDSILRDGAIYGPTQPKPVEKIEKALQEFAKQGFTPATSDEIYF